MHTIVCRVLYWFLLWCALLCVLSSFAIILTRKRESWFAVFIVFLGVLLLWMFCGYSSRAVGWSAVGDCGIS